MVDREKLDARWELLSTLGTQVPGVTANRNPLKAPPSWYDQQRFRNAQKLAQKYLLSLNIAHFIGNILLIHLPDVLIPVLATGHSSSPYQVFMRILSTIIHVMCWYDEDPFDPSSKTHQSLLTVRRNCHMAVTRMMNNRYPRKKQLWLSQFDMAMTQWSLIGIVGIRPRQCGFYSTTRYEFEEYIYFWKVIGHCVGIEDRFNVCLDHYEESVEYLDICFKRCYKVHLDRQCVAVKMGMSLTEGVFLGLNSVTPKFFITYESFMKYWYDTLGVKHPIKLDSFSKKFYYYVNVAVFDYVLQVRPLYVVISWIFFHLQKLLFTKINVVKDYCDKNYGHIEYKLECCEYDFDLVTKPADSKEIFQVENHFYKPNVSEKSR